MPGNGDDALFAMNNKTLESAVLVVPYVVWMGLMMLLPSTASAYALRSAATLACLVAGVIMLKCRSFRLELPGKAQVFLGLAVGVAVWAAWVLPEGLVWYQKLFVIGSFQASGASPYEPAVCGWPLTLARLAGSAFVIAAAEELFFRKWLFEWLGGMASRTAFLWMVVLFAVEHNRWLVAAIAGAAYGFLALRRGIGSAIIAHATTNFILGVQVILTGNWNFW